MFDVFEPFECVREEQSQRLGDRVVLVDSLIEI
jgi:hypothetical protein